MATARSSPSIVPSGCIVYTLLLVVGIAVAGYFGYRELEGAFGVPLELASFTSEDSVRARIASSRPAPPTTEKLSASWLAFYLEGSDRTGQPLLAVRDVLDSLRRAGAARGDTGMASFLTSPTFYRTVTIVEPQTKRAMVEYLNAHKRSLDEYLWAKTRVVAATDITRKSVDSTLGMMIGSHFAIADSMLTFSSTNTDRFFTRIDSLRKSGAITDDERALASPFRARLLERGLGSLYGLDTEF